MWTAPPNSQGFVLLAAARLAEMVGLVADGRDVLDASVLHVLVETSRIAGATRAAQWFDGGDARDLLTADLLTRRAAAFDPAFRCSLDEPRAGFGDTTYLCAVDAEGMAVSLIQSNANGWGVGLTVPDVGVFLHNRGIGFTLEPGGPAEYRPHVRPPHTLAPALIQTADGVFRAAIGTMGGDAQPQVVLQLVADLLVGGLAPGAALSAPRWRLGTGGFDTWADGDPVGVTVEQSVAGESVDGLRRRGHVVAIDPAGDLRFGHAHIIERGGDGNLAGAHDPRATTGSTAAW